MSAFAISTRGVRALTQLVRGSAVQTTPGFSPATVSIDALPPVYTVRWAQSENDGAGKWIIYLGADECLYENGTALSVTAGLTAATNYPSWYIVPNMENATAVRLSVLVDDATGAVQDVEINSNGSAATGETWQDYLIANVSRDASTGKVWVEQLIVGAVMLFAVADGLDAGIDVSQAPLPGDTDHPNGGIEITFQPTQGGTAVGNPTVVEIWNGADGGGGGGGGASLSDTDPLDVVTSSGNASAGISQAASRSDHIHKMPATVMLTSAQQTVTAIKWWQYQVRLAFCLTANNQQEYFFFESNANQFFLRRRFISGSFGQVMNATAGDGSTGSGTVVLGDSSVYQDVSLAYTPTDAPTTSGAISRKVPTIGWASDKLLTRETDQTVKSVKTIRAKSGASAAVLCFQRSSSSNIYRMELGSYQGLDLFQICNGSAANPSTAGNVLIVVGDMMELGGRASSSQIMKVRLGNGAWTYLQGLAPANVSGNDLRTIATAGWVDANYQRKLPPGTTGKNVTKTVITGVEWDSTNKQIKMTGEEWTFTDGLLTGVSSATIAPIDTEPYPSSS